MDDLKNILQNRSYLLLLTALFNLLLTPFYVYAIGEGAGKFAVAANYFLLIAAGYNICPVKRPLSGPNVVGVLVVTTILLEFFMPENSGVQLARILATMVFFVMLFRYTVLHLLKIDNVVFDNVLGAIAGYMIVAMFGASVFELVEYSIPGSFDFNSSARSFFQFHYFSFVCTTTVGFGDIVPTNPQSQSLMVSLSVIGQMYLAIVIALFMGKFMKSNT